MRLLLAFLFINNVISKLAVIIIGSRCNNSKLLIEKQKFRIIEKLEKNVEVFDIVNDFPNEKGMWTFVPAVLKVRSLNKNFDHYLLADENSDINLENFKFSETKSLFGGYALQDKEPTIIHHFGFNLPNDFEYPLLPAGVLISADIVDRIHENQNALSLHSFSIDPQHEFASFLYTNFQIKLTNLPEIFCMKSGPNCLVTRRESIPTSTISDEDIQVKIKTYKGNHDKRLSILKQTWTAKLKNVEYCSDFEDIDIPTIDLGLGNTERGHCAKTWGIMKRFDGSKWLLIADDDTLISWDKLKQLTSNYDSEERIIIGERYGYGFGYEGIRGYDYPTGGSGMIFTRSAIDSILSVCPSCSSPDDPDDMMLGMCAQIANVSIVHSRSLHQARPEDYSEDYLNSETPISFHKFTDTNPVKIYEDYLKTDKISEKFEL